MNQSTATLLAALLWLRPCGAVGAWQGPPAAPADAGPATPAAAGTDGVYLPDPTGPYLPYEAAWPRRAGDRGNERGHAAIVPVDVPPHKLAVQRQFRAPKELSAEDRADAAALEATLEAAPGGRSVVVEGANAILFASVPARTKRGLGVGPGTEAGPFGGVCFKVVTGVEGKGSGGGAELALERTWFAWYDALGPDGSPGEPSRAALILPGMFGNPEPIVDRMVRRLRDGGYGVLRMLAPPSRFTERAVVMVDPEHPEPGAAALGATFGGRAAECAYAAEAAWHHVEGLHPAVAGLPKAVLGMSGGAIALPTVVALRPGRYGAAVVMAGSADFWLTNERSNYREYIDALRLRWTAEPTEAHRAALDRAYLAVSPLDNFHTAGALRGRRVLFMQGLLDQAAPAALGDVLWERAGKPERWTYPVGHEDFFINLPLELDRLTAWLDAALAS